MTEIISQIPAPETPTQWLIAAVLALVMVITAIAIVKGVARMISTLVMIGAGLGLITVPAWPGADSLTSLWPF